MNVDEATRTDSSTADRKSGRSGGSHRAKRRGPSPLLLVALLVLVVLIGGFFAVRALVGGADTDQPASDASSSAASDPQASSTSGGAADGSTANAGDVGGDGAALASDPGSVSAGTSLAANDRLVLDPQETTELEEGRVDIRILSLLALLSADYTVEIGDFRASEQGAGSGLANVVDIASVDGGPAASPLGRELAAVARGQLGVYRPKSVETVDGAIRIAFAPRAIEELPPVPIP